jgi:hypothetical protein
MDIDESIANRVYEILLRIKSYEWEDFENEFIKETQHLQIENGWEPDTHHIHQLVNGCLKNWLEEGIGARRLQSSLAPAHFSAILPPIPLPPNSSRTHTPIDAHANEDQLNKNKKNVFFIY